MGKAKHYTKKHFDFNNISKKAKALQKYNSIIQYLEQNII